MDLKEAKELIEKIVLEDEISKPGILNEFILECLEAPKVSLFDKDFDLDKIYFDATEGGYEDFEFGVKHLEEMCLKVFGLLNLQIEKQFQETKNNNN